MIDFVVVIPARLKSSRLEEKLLQIIAGKPLLYWTYQNAIKSNASEVIIATDSEKIIQTMLKLGINCMLTKTSHNSGTSRIREVVKKKNFDEDTIIINVQGDEPLLPASVINQMADNITNNNVMVATLCESIDTKSDYLDSNVIKVVFDSNNYALYFSRASIPYFRNNNIDLKLCYKHIGIYGYRANFFTLKLNFNDYESAEKLEQLTIMQSGYDIHIDESIEKTGIGVDTTKDLEALRQIFKENR